MLTILRRAALCAVLMLTVVEAARAQAPQEVPRDHWAYAAVDSLANKGLIKGYPPNGDFFGSRTVTRYEMAVILQRVLGRIDELLAKKADKGEVKPSEAGVKPEQLDEVKRLVQEFRTELTVIGTDLQKVKEQIADLDARVEAARRTAEGARRAAEQAGQDAQAAAKAAAQAQADAKAAKDAAAANQRNLDTLSGEMRGHKIGGYIQARFEAFDSGRNSLFTNTGAGGTGQTPANGGPTVGGPYYGFQVRRARLKLSGQISPRTDYALQIDAPSSGAVNVKDAWINILNAPARGISLTAGQFLVPFGYELNESSAARAAPERSMAFSDSGASAAIFRSSVSATGGVVTPGSVLPLFLNQEYDTGAMLTWFPRAAQRFDKKVAEDRKTKVQVAVINGEGTVAGGIRNNNNQVDLVGRAQTGLFGNKVGLGLSGYMGSLAVRAGAPTGAPAAPAGFVNAVRLLGGADVSYVTPWKTDLRAEYVGGVQETTPDRSMYLENNHVQGWYFQARHPFTPKLDFVLKYDEYMPISEAGKTAAGLGRMDLIRKSVHAGFLYYMDPATRFRLWYQKALTPFDPSFATGPFRSRLGFVTAEVQVRY